MRIPSPYFHNTPFGDLELDQLIVDYDYPLLSVLRDTQGSRYLCFCFDIRTHQHWLITPIQREQLQELLLGQLSLSEPFLVPDQPIVHCDYDYDAKIEQYESRIGMQYPDWYYPPNEPLDVDEWEWEEYMRKLNA